MMIRPFGLLGLMLLVAAAGSAHCHCDLTESATLPQDTYLYEEEYLLSPSRTYSLWLQTDGNLVLYRGANATANGVVWNIRSFMNWPTTCPGPYKLVLQGSDANLVVLCSRNKVPEILWMSNVAASCRLVGPFFARLTDDGQLELVAANGVVYWTTLNAGTPSPPPSPPPPSPTPPATWPQGQYLRELQFLLSPSKTYSFGVQTDGDLVIYHHTATDANPVLVWALSAYSAAIPNSECPRPYKMSLQEDGKLVVLCSRNALLWSSTLPPSGIPAGPYTARMTDDGWLELVAANGVVYWTTNSRQ
ncbi:hypothetical protein VaNZ11_015643 [Volvox africanus]|uniref:Bulb-type lectin domain-containing protein n=1 Tax=Volvox africanus TaxID=51714 RepID=A0ABQ5SMQ2_9CHLO|nr:hypothetical protein VaNZ11_015643 [Volvox africanus]